MVALLFHHETGFHLPSFGNDWKISNRTTRQNILAMETARAAQMIVTRTKSRQKTRNRTRRRKFKKPSIYILAIVMRRWHHSEASCWHAYSFITSTSLPRSLAPLLPSFLWCSLAGSLTLLPAHLRIHHQLLPHGFGRCEYTRSGLVYEGEFVHGSACGEGKLMWPNGSIYQGV